MMQRRVRQKHAEIAIEWRNVIGNQGLLASSQQVDRSLRAEQQLARGIVHLAELLRRADIGNHYGKRLLDAPLALAQSSHRFSVGGVARKMKSAQALDGNYSAKLQAHNRLGDRIGSLDPLPFRIPQLNLRPAFPTGVRLRVEAPVERIFILRAAGWAHRKRGHRGERTVVRNIAHDGEAWAAVGAVDERIAITAVGGIEHLAQAVGADGDIGRDKRAYRFATMSRDNAELTVAVAGNFADCYIRNACEWRRFRRQVRKEVIHCHRRTLHLDANSRRGVTDAARQLPLSGKAIDIWPEADTLHDSGDFDGLPHQHECSRRQEYLISIYRWSAFSRCAAIDRRRAYPQCVLCPKSIESRPAQDASQSRFR